MTDLFNIIAGQIALFVLLVLVGVVAVKTGVLNQDSLQVFSRYLMRLAIPVMIFYNTVTGATRAELLASLPVILVAAAMFAGLAALSYLVSALLGLQGNAKRLYRVAGIFGNIGFMGIPLVAALFPERGMLYIALFAVVDQSLLWTLGMALTHPAEGEKQAFSLKATLKRMVSPATAAITLSVVFVLVGISLPSLVLRAFRSVADTCSPLSMIYIGGLFCFTDLAACLKKKEFYVLALTKMVLFPLAFYWVLKRLPLAPEICVTITVLSALPEMSTIPMFARANGSDGEYAVGALMVTTLLSALTLPFVAYMIGNVM